MRVKDTSPQAQRKRVFKSVGWMLYGAMLYLIGLIIADGIWTYYSVADRGLIWLAAVAIGGVLLVISILIVIAWRAYLYWVRNG